MELRALQSSAPHAAWASADRVTTRSARYRSGRYPSAGGVEHVTGGGGQVKVARVVSTSIGGAKGTVVRVVVRIVVSDPLRCGCFEEDIGRLNPVPPAGPHPAV